MLNILHRLFFLLASFSPITLFTFVTTNGRVWGSGRVPHLSYSLVNRRIIMKECFNFSLCSIFFFASARLGTLCGGGFSQLENHFEWILLISVRSAIATYIIRKFTEFIDILCGWAESHFPINFVVNFKKGNSRLARHNNETLSECPVCLLCNHSARIEAHILLFVVVYARQLRMDEPTD